MTILIVGGAGYIGSHTNKLLNQAGFDTIVLDNLVYGHKNHVKWGRFVHGDCGNSNILHDIFSKETIEGVLHFAAFSFVEESVVSPAKYYANNVVNTLNLLNCMQFHNVSNLVFSSTCAVYGNAIEIPITEQHPQQPINPYGRSKQMIEQIITDFQNAYGLKSVILRYFNAAGCDPDAEIGEDHTPETHLIPLAINTALGKQQAMKIFGTDYDTPDGSCVRDYIHVNDLANAHILALKYLIYGGDSEIFNLGNNKGHSVREVIAAVKKISQVDFPVLETDRREGDPAILISSNQKITQLLGWQPEFSSIETIIATAWHWFNKKCHN